MYVLVSRTRTDILSTLIRSLRSDLNRTGQNLFTRFINRSCEMFLVVWPLIQSWFGLESMEVKDRSLESTISLSTSRSKFLRNSYFFLYKFPCLERPLAAAKMTPRMILWILHLQLTDPRHLSYLQFVYSIYSIL